MGVGSVILLEVVLENWRSGRNSQNWAKIPLLIADIEKGVRTALCRRYLVSAANGNHTGIID